MKKRTVIIISLGGIVGIYFFTWVSLVLKDSRAITQEALQRKYAEIIEPNIHNLSSNLSVSDFLETLTPERKKEFEKSNPKELLEKINLELGELKSCNIIELDLKETRSLLLERHSVLSFKGKCSFEKNTVLIDFRMITIGSKWKIDAFEYSAAT